jgi:photosystem II stability/assembly factor-like uncharacterized protein
MMVYLATDKGIVIAEGSTSPSSGEQHEGLGAATGKDWRVVRQVLTAQHVSCILAREGVILAGTTEGVFKSEDEGKSWSRASVGLSHIHVRWLAFHPDISDLEFAGTEPAAIFISDDGANTWRERPEVAALRERHKWSLPYSPEAGCVRGFAFKGSRGYAAVEVGGVLRSEDRGETWGLALGSDGNPDLDAPPEPDIYPDIHSIQVHSSSPDLIDASTGGGFYRSADGGRTWRLLYDCYCRSAWTDPSDSAHVILGPADYVDSQGRIEETRDGGRTWTAASHGLKVPWRRHMVERFTQIGSDLLAVLSNGELWAAPLANLEWQRLLSEVRDVNAVTIMAD